MNTNTNTNASIITEDALRRILEAMSDEQLRSIWQTVRKAAPSSSSK